MAASRSTQTNERFLRLGEESLPRTYSSPRIGFQSRMRRLVWSLAYYSLYRWTPVPMHAWRCVLLRVFGARIDQPAYPYPSARIWAPWNLEMHRGSCLADGVDCYSVAHVRLGQNVTISQGSYLCSASHDYNSSSFPMICAPIHIDDNAWVCARAFVGPGVTVGSGAVVAACAVVTKDIEPWTVVAGNPARQVGYRDAESSCNTAPAIVER